MPRRAWRWRRLRGWIWRIGESDLKFRPISSSMFAQSKEVLSDFHEHARSHHIIFRSLRTSRTWIEKMRKLCKSIRKTSWCGGVEKTAVYLPAECSISLKKDRWIVALGAKAGEPDPQACHERAFNAPPGKLLVTAGELDWYEPLRQAGRGARCPLARRGFQRPAPNSVSAGLPCHATRGRSPTTQQILAAGNSALLP